MQEHFLYLTTIGRKTGLPRQIEIWFVEHQGRYYMVSERREQSNWVKNMQREPRVRFSIGVRDDEEALLPVTPARGRMVTPEREPVLAAQVSALMDDKYGWSDGLIVELEPERARDGA